MIDILEDRLPKEILTELLKDYTTEKISFGLHLTILN